MMGLRMTYWKTLWKLLDSEPVLAGVREQWEIWLGELSTIVRTFLIPEVTLAAAYPCRRIQGCARRVVVHGPGDIVAVCASDEPDCLPLALQKTDLTVYALAMDKFAGHLGQLAGFSSSRAQAMTGIGGIWALGQRTLPGGVCQNGFFVLPDPEEGYRPALDFLVARHSKIPMLVIVPIGSRLMPLERAWLAEKGVQVWACDEAFGLDKTGKLMAASQGCEPPSSCADEEERLLAIGYSNTVTGPVFIRSAEELGRWRQLDGQVEHFVNATLDRPICVKKTAGDESMEQLTQAELSMLIAYLVLSEREDGSECPEKLRLPNLTTEESRRKTFKSMRQKVDRTTISSRTYHLFKKRPAFHGGPNQQRFKPDDDATYSIIILPEQRLTIQKHLPR